MACRIHRGARLAAALLISGLAVAEVTGCAAGGNTDFEQTTSSGQGATGGTAGGTVGGTGGGGEGGGSSACAMDCSAIETDQCHQAVCNEQSGNCEIADAPEGTSCDDELFCTVDDGCSEGACVGGGQNDCGQSASPCEEISCNEASQSCTELSLADGTSCTPADLCMVNATCQNGLCSGAPKDCTFAPIPNECYNSACNSSSGDCEPVPGNDGVSCSDENDLCLVNGTCSSGSCLNTQATNCSHLTQGCVLGVCDSQNGNCVAQQLSNGDGCDDFDWCTDGETCQNGQCVGGLPVDTCQDGDNCCPSNCNEQDDADCLLLGVLYFSQDSNANGLFRLDPVTGMATAVGASGVSGGTTGLAPHPQQSQLFVSRPFGLLTAMRSGSGATGPVGSTGMEGLAYCSSNDQLYAGINGSFFLVDQATGANAGALAAPGFDAEGIACKPSTGTIYAIGGSSTSLHAYSIGSNTWSVVGSIGSGWDNAGLAYDPGSDMLYAMADGKGQSLYAINPQSAGVTTVGATGISGTANGGLAFGLGPHP